MTRPFLREMNVQLGTVGTTLVLAFVVLKLAGVVDWPWWMLAVVFVTVPAVGIIVSVAVRVVGKRGPR